MTTPEHTLVGIHVAFAVGVHSRLGWSAVVLAAIASNILDLDGLPMFIDMERFESVHRVWGHNLFVILFSSAVMAWTQSRIGWTEKLAKQFAKLLPDEARATVSEPIRKRSAEDLFWIAFLVQVVHLPCDMVVSGGQGLSDWLVYPFWPFVDWGFVYPLIPWGDIGPTVILMLGAIALAKFPKRINQISFATLTALCIYLISRGIFRGTISISF